MNQGARNPAAGPDWDVPMAVLANGRRARDLMLEAASYIYSSSDANSSYVAKL